MSDGSAPFLVNVEAAIFRAGRYVVIERAGAEDHAAGQLGFVGGTVEPGTEGTAVLERTVRREVREEVGVDTAELYYVRSNAFVDDGDSRVVNVVFLTQHGAGEPHVADPKEVGDVAWLDPDAIREHPQCPPWTRAILNDVEARRQTLGW